MDSIQQHNYSCGSICLRYLRALLKECQSSGEMILRSVLENPEATWTMKTLLEVELQLPNLWK